MTKTQINSVRVPQTPIRVAASNGQGLASAAPVRRRRMSAWVLSLGSLVTLAGLGMSACAPSVVTQADRYDYIEPSVSDGLDKQMRCNKRTVTFVETTRDGFEDYDHYIVEGCGQRSELLTKVSKTSLQGTVTMWANWRLVPSEKQFVDASEAQLRKTAGFEMECQAIEFETIEALIAPMRETTSSTVGVTGCGKKRLYRVMCMHSGYDGKEHQIACQSMSGPPTGAP